MEESEENQSKPSTGQHLKTDSQHSVVQREDTEHLYVAK